MRPVVVALASALLLAGCLEPDGPAPDAPPPRSPYAGQEARELKAIAPEDVEGYRTGAGLGYAKPAELNRHPGPLHVLELAEDLGLDDAQVAAVRAVREDVLAAAVPLGHDLLAIEGAIEEGFRAGTLDADGLRALLADAAGAEARLRYVHLEAHLRTRALLTDGQVARYDELRGYSAAPEPAENGSDPHAGHAGH